MGISSIKWRREVEMNLKSAHRSILLVAAVIALTTPFILNDSQKRNKINSAERFSQNLENIINEAILSPPFNVRRNIEQPNNIVSIMTQGAEIKVIYMSGGLWGEQKEKEITMHFSGINDIELSGFMIGKGTYEIHAYQTLEQILYVECKKVT